MAHVSARLSSVVAPLTGVHAGSFTLTFWLNPLDGGEAVALVMDRAWFVALNSDGTLTFTINDSSTSTESSVSTTDLATLNAWNFVAAVYDTAAGTISLFLNGVKFTASYAAAANDSVSVYSEDFRLGDTEAPIT